MLMDNVFGTALKFHACCHYLEMEMELVGGFKLT